MKISLAPSDKCNKSETRGWINYDCNHNLVFVRSSRRVCPVELRRDLARRATLPLSYINECLDWMVLLV